MARRRNPGGKPGNPGKGERSAITVRVPTTHKSRYEAEAARRGLSVSDYLTLRMAQLHDLDAPSHLQKQQQQTLPIGA